MKINNIKKIARDYWEKTPQQYSRKMVFNSSRDFEWKVLREFFNISSKSHKNIVDLGCGTGHHAVRFLMEGFKVTAIDTSFSALKILRERAEAEDKEQNLRIVKNDLSGPFFDKKFDAGYMISVYMSLSNDRKERLKILRNFVKGIKIGGKFFMMEPNPYDPLYIFFLPFVYKKNWREGLNIINSRKKIIYDDLKEVGIDKISYRPYGFLPTFLMNSVKYVANFNEIFCKLPLINNMCAFHMVLGTRIK